MLSAPQAEATPILLWRAVLSWLGALDFGFRGRRLALGIGGITLIGSPLLQHEENAPFHRVWGAFAAYFAGLSVVHSAWYYRAARLW